MKYNEEIRVIRGSEYFDKEWYQKNNPPVELLGMEPAEHYLRFGARLKADPSPFFSTLGYLQRNPDVASVGQNPLLHFELVGRKEHRSWRLPPTPMPKEFSKAKPFQRIYEIEPKNISVIVPIFNGISHIERLLPRLISNTGKEVDVILVDDASSDAGVATILQQYSQVSNVRVLKNETNLGFLKTVNKAAHLARRHFCLLNSDTDVPLNWLPRLMKPIFENPEVASTTPFSNSATIFSFPNWLIDNDQNILPSLDTIDELFRNVTVPSKVSLDCPTGVGFCMGINGDIWRSIGGFDENAFGKGYAEENDWCQRAIAAGYRNILIPDLYVAHFHGGSFTKEDKQRLITANSETLSARWPSYNKQVEDFIRLDPWKSIRETVFARMFVRSKVIIFFDHGLGGGTLSYYQKEKQKLLQKGISIARIFYDREMQSYLLQLSMSDSQYDFSCQDLNGLSDFISAIDELELRVNNLVSWPDLFATLEMISSIARMRSCTLLFLLHDYYPVCSSYTLLDHSDTYCSIPSAISVCENCVLKNNNAMSRAPMVSWRMAWDYFFEACTKIEVFSQSSLELFLKVFECYRSKVYLKPHEPLQAFNQLAWRQGTMLRLAIVGNLNLAKGAKLLTELVKHIDEQNLDVKVFLIGNIDPKYEIASSRFEATGTYDHNALPQILSSLEVNVAFVPSIWPETFSYVTQELIQLNLPVVCLDLGGQADQVRNFSKGKVTTSDDPSSILSACYELLGRLNTTPNLKGSRL